MSYTQRHVGGKRRTPSPEWRNRQTHETQNLAFLTGRAGSTPASGTKPFHMRQTFFLALLLTATSAFTLPPQGVEPARHFILQSQHALDAADVAALESEGVTVQRVLGANRFQIGRASC